eukprot:7836691-Pyramimonas_sp.AAC.1
MRDAARESPAPSWWLAAGQIMAGMSNGPLPNITVREGFRRGGRSPVLASSPKNVFPAVPPR